MKVMLVGLTLLTLLAAAPPAPAAPRQRPAPNARGTQLTETEFKRWMEEHAALLSRLDETLKGPLSQPLDFNDPDYPNTGKPKFTPEQQRAEDKMIKTLKVVCLVYLRATPGQRERIRRMFDGKEIAVGYLTGYPSHAAEQIRSKRDEEWVLVGLAAASIQDNRVDFRDTYVALGDLYVSAFKAGIEPGIHFKRVGLLSSDVPSLEGQYSMREFLVGFERSAFFRFDVARRLPRRGVRGARG